MTLTISKKTTHESGLIEITPEDINATIENGELVVDSEVVIKSPDQTKWRVMVNDVGAMVTEVVT